MSSPAELCKQWGKKATDEFKGKTVSQIRYLTDKEMKSLMWYCRAPVIIFTDGSYIMASTDDEGNGPGAFHTSAEKELCVIPVI